MCDSFQLVTAILFHGNDPVLTPLDSLFHTLWVILLIMSVIPFLFIRYILMFVLQVLACAPSNIAVDNLVGKLAHAKAKV